MSAVKHGVDLLDPLKKNRSENPLIRFDELRNIT